MVAIESSVLNVRLGRALDAGWCGAKVKFASLGMLDPLIDGLHLS